jgi:hypothetical protein
VRTCEHAKEETCAKETRKEEAPEEHRKRRKRNGSGAGEEHRPTAPLVWLALRFASYCRISMRVTEQRISLKTEAESEGRAILLYFGNHRLR